MLNELKEKKRIGAKMLCVFVLLVSFTSAFSQKVYNVSFMQDGPRILDISYNLKEVSKISVTYKVGDGRETMISRGSLTGDVGKHVLYGKNKHIQWDVFKDIPNSDVESDITVYVKARMRFRTFVLFNMAYSPAPQLSYGFAIGQVRKAGWYVKCRSSFDFKQFNKTTMNCDNTGRIVSGGTGTPFYSGNVSNPHLLGTGGLVVRCGIPLSIYTGLGYGLRETLWETNSKGGNSTSTWVKNSDSSYQGIVMDFGLMYNTKYISIMAGVTHIFDLKYNRGTYLEFEFGIGYVY